jgi:nucleoside-diphosphate-sugar epimerase
VAASAPRIAFVAGASGAIGRVLCGLLLADGWRVFGTTRSPDKAPALARLGVAPVVLDVYDREALVRAVALAAPEVVLHQLTDLPQVYSAAGLAAARAGNARIREVGTENLVAAATQAGARRVVAQSIAFAYAPGPRPHAEDAPLDPARVPGVARLEELVLGCKPEGIVLRYGRLYGPGTWFAVPTGEAPVHVAAAADAARRAATRGASGVYNVAEDDGVVSSARARRELGWNPAFRAPPARRPRG